MSLSEFLFSMTRCDDLYHSAINIVRSLPEVTTALVGMEKVEYTRSNLNFVTCPSLTPSKVLEFKNMVKS